MFRRRLIALLPVALGACATAPVGPQPFDLSDPVPDELQPQELTQGSFRQLLRDRVSGMTDSSADRTAADVFSRPAGSITTVRNRELRFIAIVASANDTHYAVLLRSSDQGYPILPVERVATALTIEGITAKSQYAFSEQVSRCLASNGRCTVLITFDSGAAFACTFHVELDRPSFLITDTQFLRSGRFSPQGYMLVFDGGHGTVVTSGRGNASHKKVPLLVPPRPSPRFPTPQTPPGPVKVSASVHTLVNRHSVVPLQGEHAPVIDSVSPSIPLPAV